MLDETEAPQGGGSHDAALGVSGYTEGFLDGPFDFAYSRIDRYMDTSKKPSDKIGIKAQIKSYATGNY